MKKTVVSGGAIAAAAVALVFSGAAASAKDEPQHAKNPPTEKMACGGKNGCGAAMGKDAKAKDSTGAHPAASGEKSGEAK